jgi:hypothetical protein
MNDLDRKIAELKGLWTKHWPYVCENPDKREETRVECDWSTSDSKALELVDELQGKFRLRLLSSPSGLAWQAHFDECVLGLVAFTPGKHFSCATFQGIASSRPEAICRAYIAARTWMREKKG